MLDASISRVGLTSGMDIGRCIKIMMNGRQEYIGRPLNVAARLQGAIGQRDKKPQNKVVLSKSLFQAFEDRQRIMRRYKVWEIKRQLKNISRGDDFRCIKAEHRRQR